MAFVYADRVKETTLTTGTGTLNLAGAVTGFQTFVAGIGNANTCPYVIEDADGSAWEVGIGTVTDATPDTLARTTLLASSTGSAINLSAGTHTVFVDWVAARARQSPLEHVAGTDANTTMAVGQMYVTDMSAWATADRTYTLPATAAVGDRCGIMVSSGDASHELLVTANTGDTLNGVSGGTEWSRVFITGEVLIFRCIAANATWIVEHDGRIPQQVMMRLSTSASAESAGTWTPPTTKSGAWTADVNVGSAASTSNDRIIVRRAGNFSFSIAYFNTNSVSDQKAFGGGVWKNGTVSGGGTLVMNFVTYMSDAAGGSAPAGFAVNNVPLVADDYLVYHYYSQEGSRGLTGGASPSLRSSFGMVEVF